MEKESRPRDMETLVRQTLTGAVKSREGWEAQRKEDAPPLSDVEITLENVIEEVRRHGLIVSQLAVRPETRAELQASLPGAIERIPAWMDARVFGPPLMTPGLFVRGLAQLLAVHREAIERVVEDQVTDRGAIEELLAAAPVPGGGDGESDKEVTEGIGLAMPAHAQALIHIAMDLDAWVAEA